MSAAVADVRGTYGALLIGGIIAAGFSGVVTVQCFSYFKFYPSDPVTIKLLVSAVWFLDFCHTVFISTSLWDHLIVHFGDVKGVDYIPWSLALTITFTAILTFLVHCFFVHRIFKLSRSKMYIAIPLTVLAALRLSFACLTTAKMIALGSFDAFVQQYTWSFTLGLAISSTMDILITSFLCYFLMSGRTQNPSINHLLDSLMLYAFENGSLTCASTIVSMIFWLVTPTNLVFMGLHFVIGKFYANSLLATLLTRKKLQRAHTAHSGEPDGSDRNQPVTFPSTFRSSRIPFMSKSDIKSSALQINVEKTMICTVDDTTSIGTPTTTNGGA